MEELKIGDTLFAYNYYSGLSKITVLRETPTTYVLERDIRLDKPFKDGCYAKGDKDGWGHKTQYLLPNEKHISDYNYQNNKRYVENFKWAVLSREDLEEVTTFIKLKKPKP